MNTQPVVSVQGLGKRYGARWVVRDIDFSVGSGEIVGLIGSNGAGKTTTVECLQGLRHPDAGQVRVLGLDPVTQLAELRPQVGVQLQEAGLPDRLRVAEAIDLFREGPRRAARELAVRFGLEPRLGSPYASLSGGERQRLFLVLALLNQPRLVILDELTQNLDPAARRDVWQAIRQLRDAGTTVLLVTHELEEAEVLCDRVVAMRSGRILDQGPPAELVARHGGGTSMSFSSLGVSRATKRRLVAATGVSSVVEDGGQLSFTGDQVMVAHLGALLVAAGEVPDDLRVSMPRLEDALVSLLSSDTSESHTQKEMAA